MPTRTGAPSTGGSRVHDELARAIAHDLQEPLRVVIGHLDLLRREPLPEPAASYALDAAEGAERLQRMLEGMLEVSRADAARIETAYAVDVNLALAEALRNLSRALDESGGRVESDALPAARADAVQLLQVFQNLVGNALKFRADVSPLVRVTGRLEGDTCTYCVADNGIGIAPEHQAHIFSLFRRAHGDRYPGAGVGLALSRRIVERHGGRIWVESEPGAGARFYFTLPSAAPENAT
jgi:chemotaxis family two-component system sensor kinase Cph1